MSELTHDHLAGEDSDVTVSIDTEGRVFRPLLAIVGAVVDEAKWRFDGDGLSVRAVDPANVCMVELDAPASAFESYECDGELVVGYNHTTLRAPLQNARYGKQSSDDVSLSVESRYTNVAVRRPFDHSTLNHTRRVATIDPDSIRQEPDLPSIDYPWRATVDVDALKAAVDYAKDAYGRKHRHITIQESDGELCIEGHGETDDDVFTFDAPAIEQSADGVTDPEGAASMLALDYVTDTVGSLKRGLVDTVTIEWADEYPVALDFERERDGETVYSGRFMQAPRVQS